MIINRGLSTYIISGTFIFIGLYFSRLYNPLYVSIIGESNVNLELANSCASLPLNAYWDSKSANDSMKPRLRRMEKYIGLALSSTNNDNNMITKANNIRIKGYTNGAITAKNRAKYYAESGELVKFDGMMDEIESYKMEGAIIDDKGISFYVRNF